MVLLTARNYFEILKNIISQSVDAPYYGAEDNVMSLIRRIRKKIEPDPAKPIYILTVWGVGYKI